MTWVKQLRKRNLGDARVGIGKGKKWQGRQATLGMVTELWRNGNNVEGFCYFLTNVGQSTYLAITTSRSTVHGTGTGY